MRPSDYRLADGRPRVTRRDQLVFESAAATIGLFEARPDDDHFACSGAPEEPLVFFPSRSVFIRHEGRRPFLADRNIVTLHDPDQVYYRSVSSPEGDRGHWFSFPPETVEELTGKRSRGGRSWFRRGHAPCSDAAYRTQAALVRGLSAGRIDTLEAEETALALARSVLAGPGPERIPFAWRQLAERARVLLAERYPRPESLGDIGRSLGCSTAHLSRVFPRATGMTLHRYRDRLRLRRALVELPERRSDLTELALDLGYSSHSHFSYAFRRAFGVSPSHWRTSGG